MSPMVGRPDQADTAAMTIQLTTTHRRLAGVVVGLWLGIHLTILSGLPFLMLGLPLLGALTFGLLDGSGRLLARAVGLCLGIMTAEAVFTAVNLVVAPAVTLPLELLAISIVSVVLGRSIRLVPVPAPIPAPSR